MYATSVFSLSVFSVSDAAVAAVAEDAAGDHLAGAAGHVFRVGTHVPAQFDQLGILVEEADLLVCDAAGRARVGVQDKSREGFRDVFRRIGARIVGDETVRVLVVKAFRGAGVRFGGLKLAQGELVLSNCSS